MVKLNQQTADHIFFTIYLGWLFAIDWIWPNSSGRTIMLIYFGSTLGLKILHFIYYLSCPSDTQNCCGQLVKWLGVIGSLLKIVDVRQVMLGTQINNGKTGEYNQLAINLVFHLLNLAYILASILYFYFKKRKQDEKVLRHVSLNVNSTSFM